MKQNDLKIIVIK